MRRYPFVDKSGLDIGSLEDVILRPKDLYPSHLLLGAGFFEEYMEEIGKRENIDEIAELGLVTIIGDEYFQVESNVADLPLTKDGTLGIPGVLFSSLSTLKIFDGESEIDAELFDLEFDYEKSSFVINHYNLQSQLRGAGYYQRLEVYYPIKYITVTDTQLILPITTEQLFDRIQKEMEPLYKGKSAYYYTP